ncbi:uncharacterized protein F4822DRAFT_251166 [Hypoxylon trugodes]|uniref:uncharacterized protein n=1 Tax=Hypoxylon trugodes TaxID=326681 RepID=UPI00219AA4CC|nr:uncharacterized protein F4822DRAFT_251166 [Hypoxylon trugodes]KAI1388598.1 hypothetical protein F4822DRAFT_251166 [Hypoxylon trugodes]
MASLRRLLTTLSRPIIRLNTPHLILRRSFSAEAVSHLSNRVQVYISRATDPYLNLSIEHFLLQKSPPDSVVLFLYGNRPCVVIGRNQNPWVEVNLGLLNRKGGNGVVFDNNANAEDNDTNVLLVRRRSGGGTVFHDSGNMNYSVICPPASFDRDKHALMVVRALQNLGVSHTRVNSRHDIVLDVPPSSNNSHPQNELQTFKISGSAYKLTRLRSLHHGTCLLSSPNLPLVSPLLRSPAAPYIRARGVESVRSPVRNVGMSLISDFADAVVSEFHTMYGNTDVDIVEASEAEGLLGEIPDIAKGYSELKSPEWIYTQTPQFTFSTHPTEDDPRPRPPLPKDLPPDFRATFTVRHGQVTDVSGTDLLAPLKSTYLHHVTNWRPKVSNEPVGKWLNGLFGVGGGI